MNNISVGGLKKKDILIRLSIVILSLAFWMAYRFYYLHDSKKPWTFNYCINDKLLTWAFYDLTRYAADNWYIRNFFLISGSNILDIYFISFLIVFIKKGNSWKPILHLLLFYGIRNVLVQGVFLFEIYDTYIFGDPGFPSIIVPFFRAPDFFYSGHAGCAVLTGLQFSDLGHPKLLYVGIIIALYEGFIMSVTRAHYSIDIIFGMMMAHYIYFLSEKLAKYTDKYIPVCGKIQNTAIEPSKIEPAGNSDLEGDYKDVHNITH
jgi:hypothetical protein